MVDLILASASPRRLELLHQLGLRLRVQPAHIDETPQDHEKPHAYVQRVAHEKCLAQLSATAAEGLPLLAADTTVILDQTILGKPEDASQATHMLQQLSGKRHEVATAFCISFQGHVVQQMVTTQVVFRAIDASEMKAYVDSNEWNGKAGGYAIQGRAAAFVTEVRGSITNVIGLPLAEVLLALRSLGALPCYPPPAYGATA